MKFRKGFVSNSSSCSFTVINLTDKPITWAEFATEVIPIMKEYLKEYGTYDVPEDMSVNQYIDDYIKKSTTALFLRPNEETVENFGDNDGFTGLVGSSLDYMLRYRSLKTDKVHIIYREMCR